MKAHLGEHLLRNATIHRDGKRLRREVVERNLLPQGDAQPIGKQGQHLVRRMVVDTNQVGVDFDRALQERLDRGRRGERAAGGTSFRDRQLLFLVHSDAIEDCGDTVEKDARSSGVDAHLAEAEAGVEVVDRLVVGKHGHLQNVERGEARAPEVRGADRAHPRGRI